MDKHQIIINIQPKRKLVKLDPIEDDEISNSDEEGDISSEDETNVNDRSIYINTKIGEKLKINLKSLKQITNIVDNVSLTTKNIIFTFWYIILCYDESKDNRFINVDEEYILDVENNFNIRKEHFLIDVLKKLKKEWHKQINKIDINFSKIKRYYNPEQILKCSDKINKPISKLIHCIVPIDVYFHLIKKIHHIKEFDVNGKFLHQLIKNEMKHLILTLENNVILSKYLPFNKDIDDIDEYGNELINVTPNISFIPLYNYNYNY